MILLFFAAGFMEWFYYWRCLVLAGEIYSWILLLVPIFLCMNYCRNVLKKYIPHLQEFIISKTTPRYVKTMYYLHLISLNTSIKIFFQNSGLAPNFYFIDSKLMMFHQTLMLDIQRRMNHGRTSRRTDKDDYTRERRGKPRVHIASIILFFLCITHRKFFDKRHTSWYSINSPSVHQFLKIVEPQCKNVISCQVVILYLDFVVRITSNVSTLILDLVLYLMRFTYRDHLRSPLHY